MPDERDDITTDSSPVENDVEQDSSLAEPEQTTEPTDDSQGVQEEQAQEKGNVPYDRFAEINERMKAAEERAVLAEQRMVEAYQNARQTPPQERTQQEIDLLQKYGQDANTREFLRDIRADIRREANKIADERASVILRENEALKRTVAGVQEKLFRQENKDVGVNSKEEAEIAQMVSMGIPLDKATKAVMYDKRIEEAKRSAQVKQKTTTKAKINANLETQTIPKTSGLPQNTKLSFRDDLRRRMMQSGV